MISVKILIWLLCFFVVSVIQTAAHEAGVILGAIPAMLLFGLAWWSAKKLCALWDQRQAEKAALSVSESPIPDPLPAEQEPTIADPAAPAPATPKLRFCKHCGSPIDPTTRQCTGCGKQYFRPPVLRKKHLAIAAGVLACAAVALLIFNLITQLHAAESKVEALNAQITDLNAKLEEQKDISLGKEKVNSALKSTFDDLQKRYDDLREENTMNKELLSFYEEYVAFIGDSESMDYHKLPCPYMDAGEGISAYNISLLEEYGYEPCPYCGG